MASKARFSPLDAGPTLVLVRSLLRNFFPFVALVDAWMTRNGFGSMDELGRAAPVGIFAIIFWSLAALLWCCLFPADQRLMPFEWARERDEDR